MGVGGGIALSRDGNRWSGFHGQRLVNKTIQSLCNGQFWLYIADIRGHFKRSVTRRRINLGFGDWNSVCGYRLANSDSPSICQATNLVLVIDACHNLGGEILK